MAKKGGNPFGKASGGKSGKGGSKPPMPSGKKGC